MRKVSRMSPRNTDNGPVGEIPADWPGSPLSTLHHQAPASPIRTEAFARDGHYIIRFELPGIDPDTGLEVSVDASVLSVHAERPVGNEGHHHSEFRYGMFHSHVTLPAGADTSDVTATCENGVLEVSIGMPTQLSARKVEVATPSQPPRG